MNSVAVITGASRGIGRGIAIELARAGWDLVINFVRAAAAAGATAVECKRVAAAAGHEIRPEICQADIALSQDRARLLDFTKQKFGRLDLLVNNAGVAPEQRADLLETTEASFDRLMATNLKGPYFLTQAAARWMIEQNGEEAGSAMTVGRPRIVFITSVSAYAASVNRGEYCVAKAGLSMVAQLFAARLAPHGVQVFEIRPGIIATDMTGAVKEKYNRLIAEGLTPIRRWGEPEDVGKAVAAVAQGALPFSTGQVIDVDGGFHMRIL
jgi:3-oxoacyl-[acyl-carrier protein] reductase